MILLLALFTAIPLHDYHISKTNVRYVADAQELQVEMHLFAADLEAAMREAGAPPALEIGTERQHPDADRYLREYLRRNFRVDIDGRPSELDLVGYELADDRHGLYIYLRTNSDSRRPLPANRVPSPPLSLKVTNSLLTETYPDQKNIVKVYDGNEQVGTLLFSRQRIRGTVEFSPHPGHPQGGGR